MIERRNHGGVVLALVPRVLFTAIGLSILWFLFLKPFLEGTAAKSWPTAEGTVISAYTEERRSSKIGDTRRDLDMSKDVVVYRYTVNNKDYKGARIGVFTDWSVTAGLRPDRLRRYPEGATPLVHYNPQNPERAVLEPGMGPDRFIPYTLLGLGGFFTMVGFASVILTIARGRPKEGSSRRLVHQISRD